MNINSLIERNGLARFASCLTLGGGKITDGVEILISRRTVSRINFDPMSAVQTTTGSDMSFDTITKASHSGFYFSKIAMIPIANAFLCVVKRNAIQKRMRMRPTMTGFILSDNIKRTTHDDRTVFVPTQIDQIVAIIKRKCHVLNSRCVVDEHSLADATSGCNTPNEKKVGAARKPPQLITGSTPPSDRSHPRSYDRGRPTQYCRANSTRSHSPCVTVSLGR